MALVGVQYVGKKKSHLDHLYGTNLTWLPGQTHNIQETIAQKMAKHTDVYAITLPVAHIVPAAAGIEPEEVAPTVVEAFEDDTFVLAQPEEVAPTVVPLPPLDNMTRDELMSFAQQHYGEKLHHSMKEETMRHKIVSLINERGR